MLHLEVLMMNTQQNHNPLIIIDPDVSDLFFSQHMHDMNQLKKNATDRKCQKRGNHFYSLTFSKSESVVSKFRFLTNNVNVSCSIAGSVSSSASDSI